MSSHFRIFLSLMILLFLLWEGEYEMHAEVPIVAPTLGEKTLIAPAYFGPNAFAVPDMIDGRVQRSMRVEMAGDYYLGHQQDRTQNIFMRAFIPLFTDRVNLTLWMPVQEWYQMTPDRQRICRLQDTVAIRGRGTGDVYISTDIQLLRDKRIAPDIVLRAAMKTASGGSFEQARHYDCPGYFFDVSAGKSFYFGGTNSPITDHPCAITERGDCPIELRVAASTGFLCWQTDNGRQNDAVMYGAQLMLRVPYFSLRETFTGYSGWERAGDRPMVITTTMSGHIPLSTGSLHPFFTYQYGLRDYPFHQFRLGLAYEIDIIGLAKSRNKNKLQ